MEKHHFWWVNQPFPFPSSKAHCWYVEFRVSPHRQMGLCSRTSGSSRRPAIPTAEWTVTPSWEPAGATADVPNSHGLVDLLKACVFIPWARGQWWYFFYDKWYTKPAQTYFYIFLPKEHDWSRPRGLCWESSDGFLTGAKGREWMGMTHNNY